MLATEAEPAWTAEEIAGTFHVSEENITHLQEDDNGHTLFVLDEYTFVCAPNGARTAAVTYTADYPIELIVSCTENGVMLGSALPYVENPSDGMIWDGTYEFLDYDTGAVTPVKDANAFYGDNAIAPLSVVSYNTTINGKAIPHPDYDPNNGNTVYWRGWYDSVNLDDGGTQCHGFALFIFDYLFNGYGKYVYDFPFTAESKLQDYKLYLRQQQPGTFIRVIRPKSPHSQILVGSDNLGIYVYHANWAGDDVVSFNHFTWSAFVDKFAGYLEYFITPTDYITSSYSA